MKIEEIKIEKLQPKAFVKQKVNEISSIVGDSLAINALSGGVDSSAVTMLGHKALGNKLKTYFVDNGIMREGEPEWIASLFKKMGVTDIILKPIDLKNLLSKLQKILGKG